MAEKIVKDSQGLAKDLANDCISRQAAIDIVNKYNKSHMILMGKPMLCAAPIVIELEDLPSAQPKSAEQTAETAQNVSDSDLISRKAAIDAFDGVKVDEENCTEYDIGYNDGIDFAVSRLSVLPSAQPERQRGEWIDYTEDGYVECPFCHSATNCDGNKDELHFCFSCGADMRKDEQE